MGGILQVDTIQNNNTSTLITQTNATTITIGTSGNTITIPSGVTFNTASASISLPAGSISNADIATAAAIATTKLGAGAVLQVVQSTYSIEVTTTSTTYVTTNLSASITPSSSSNKILILVSNLIDMGTLASSGGVYGTNNGGDFTIYRGTSTALLSRAGDTFYNNGGLNIGIPMSMSVLDSPSTTSSTTYSLYMKTRGGSPTPTLKSQHNGSEGSIILIEIKG